MPRFSAGANPEPPDHGLPTRSHTLVRPLSKWDLSPFEPGAVQTAVYILIYKVLRPSESGNRLLPSHQFYVITQLVCPTRVELGDDVANNLSLFCKVPRRGEKNTEDFARVSHDASYAKREMTSLVVMGKSRRTTNVEHHT